MNETKLNGIVVALQANYLLVEIDLKNQKIDNEPVKLTRHRSKVRLLSKCRSKLNYNGKYVKVGDYVLVESIDWNASRAIISDLLPRKNLLKRPAVANVDKVFITASCREPIFDNNQVSRFLLTAEKSNLDICLLITKIDLLLEDNIDSQLKKLKDWGYEIIIVSVKTGYGINDLYDSLSKSNISVFSGPSGVGKTSLINKLLVGKDLPVGSLSKRLQRGKNTTRHVELYSLRNGSRIADTPGFNKPDINCERIKLQLFFPEIRSQLTSKSCKFRDCLHQDELGCMLNKNWSRYSLYRNYLEELVD